MVRIPLVPRPMRFKIGYLTVLHRDVLFIYIPAISIMHLCHHAACWGRCIVPTRRMRRASLQFHRPKICSDVLGLDTSILGAYHRYDFWGRIREEGHAQASGSPCVAI